MRVVNTGKKSFRGIVIVCRRPIYINIGTGEGFHDMFDAMGGNISRLANIIVPIVGSKDDAKQEVCLIMLEGLTAYDHNRGVAMSTFLYKYAQNKLFDLLRTKKGISMDYFNGALMVLDDLFEYNYVDVKLDLMCRIKTWDDKWRHIMFRLFVDGEKIMDVATDVDMTPWGLTRAVRRKLEEARNI